LTLPADLTPNIFNEENKILNNTNASNNVPKIVNNQPRRKSPGGNTERRKNIKSTSSNKCQNGFLFNFDDPVWKPLSEMDDELDFDWSVK
jgi:hypothetical protein